MTPLMTSVIVFLVVAGLVGLVALLFRDPEAEKATERLETLVGRAPGQRTSTADILLKQAMQGMEKQTLLDRITPEFFKFRRLFEQADANIRPSALFGIALTLGLFGAMLSTLAVNIYVAPVGGLLFFSLPFIWLLYKRNTRLKAFAAQLPDAMELVARALRAGHSLASGMHVVAEELPPPISKEFARVYDEQNLGIPLEEALKGMCDRVPNLDLKFFVTSVAIQRQTGGDLAEILDRIGYVIRERFKILGQVKALTAEGRLSGIVLIALPVGLFFLMLHMKPDYIKLLWTDEMGIKMSIAAIVLMLIGSYAIKKIVDIRV
ncbi:MAG TPA: type II secretion system F family protein [Gemmataceae bacterium]